MAELVEDFWLRDSIFVQLGLKFLQENFFRKWENQKKRFFGVFFQYYFFCCFFEALLKFLGEFFLLIFLVCLRINHFLKKIRFYIFGFLLV